MEVSLGYDVADDQDLPPDFQRARMRLKLFAASFAQNGTIDAASMLTREDLEIVIAALDNADGMVTVPYIKLGRPAGA